MTRPRSLEEVVAERIKTLDNIQATLERISYLINLVPEYSNLERQWSGVSYNSPSDPARRGN